MFSQLSGCYQFFVSLFKDFYVSAFEFIQWGDVPDGAVQPGLIVIRDVLLDYSTGIFEGKWYPGADAFFLDSSVIVP